MITGNFQLDVVGVNVQFDYTLNPHHTDHRNYDFVFFEGGRVITKEKVIGDPLMGAVVPLESVIFQRVWEQKSVRPKSIGVNVK